MITIRPMQTSDIFPVTLLHHSSLSETFSSKMGLHYLRLLYHLLVMERTFHIGLVAEDRGTIIGAIIATKDFGKTQALITKRLFWFSSPLVFWAMVMGRLTLHELINYMRFEMLLRSRFPKSRATVLALFVDNRFRRHGIGKNLVMTIMKKFMHQGHDRLYVDTLMSNETAQRFYRALGFHIIESVFDSVVLARRL